MNPPRATIETITGMLTLPVPVAAQVLGISIAKLRRELPVVSHGYRSKSVTISAMREWLDKKETKPATPGLRVIRTQ
jgi:hypothetical protein